MFTSVAALAAEFTVHVDGSSVTAVAQALTVARQHRSDSPDDTVIVDLPDHLTFDRTLILGPQDSGRPGAPLILRGRAGQGTVITGARTLDETSLDDASRAAVSRMPSSVRSQVRAYALGPLTAVVQPAFAPISSAKGGIPGRLFVFEGERRLRAARWPTQGFLLNPDMIPGGSNDTSVLRNPQVAALLEGERDAWATGYWGWNWWYEVTKVRSADNGQVVLTRPEAPLRAGARFAFLNVAAGLDSPGKVYVDQSAGHVLLVPERPGVPITVPGVRTLLRLVSAENIRIENISFEMSIDTTVSIEQSSSVVLRDCRIAHSGTTGLVVAGGRAVRVERCIVEDTGYGAIALDGGDLKSLTPAGHVIENCRLSHFGVLLPAYQPGVRLSGVGMMVTGNEISDAPHAGIIFVGNDHRITGNILHGLVLDSEDAGAIYGGRSWSARGTVIASNYLHSITNHIGTSLVRGVYLDDQLSGTTVSKNVFVGVDQAILVGGGRDNVISGNLTLAGRGAQIVLDARGLNWQVEMVRPGGALWKSLQMDPTRSAIYAGRYPGFATVLADRPGSPVGNRFDGNMSDRSPVITYETPNIAKFGTEVGSHTVFANGHGFPHAGNPLPAGDAGRDGIEKTRQIILGTLQALQSLTVGSQAGR